MADADVGAGWTVEAVVELSLLFFVMTSLGATIDFEEFKRNFKSPKGILACMIVQYGLVPPFAYGFAQGVDLNTSFAVGLIIIASCPGGAVSNLFCYFFKADLPLSIAMTTASSLVAMGALPANLYLYLEATGLSRDVELNLIGIAASAATVVVGTFFGIWVKERKRVARIFHKIGVLAMILLLAWSIVANLTSDDSFADEPNLVPLGFACLAPTLLGLVLGFAAGILCRLTKQQQLALAIEVSFRNKVIAIAIISLTFDDKDAKDRAIIMPLAYGFMSLVTDFFVCLLGWKLGYTYLDDDLTLYDLFWGRFTDDYKERRRVEVSEKEGNKALLVEDGLPTMQTKQHTHE